MSTSDSWQGISVRRVFRRQRGQNPLAAYFALAYGITWLFSAVATPSLLSVELPTIVRNLGAILWHFGPALCVYIPPVPTSRQMVKYTVLQEPRALQDGSGGYGWAWNGFSLGWSSPMGWAALC